MPNLYYFSAKIKRIPINKVSVYKFQMKSVELLPILIEESPHQASFEIAAPVDMKSEPPESFFQGICTSVNDWFKTGEYPKDLFPEFDVSIILCLIFE